jgi:hypothetical protein
MNPSHLEHAGYYRARVGLDFVNDSRCVSESKPIHIDVINCMVLHPDTLVARTNAVTVMDVLVNDEIPETCALPTLTIFTNPTRGSAIINTDGPTPVIYYEPNISSTLNGVDSLEYQVQCERITKTAKVYIYV